MSITIFLVCLVVGGISFLYYKFHKRIHYFQALGIACEEPSWGLGSFTDVKRRHFSEIFTDYYLKFKGSAPFVGFYWFHRPAAYLLDPQLISNVLIKDFNKFTDRGGFYSNEKDDPLSGQLFLLEGERWRQMRHKLTPVFTSGKMKFMFPTIMEVGQRFVRVFEETMEQNPIVEVKDLLARFTTDVIGTCVFGIECNSLKDPNVEFRLMGKKALSPDRNGKLGNIIIGVFPDIARKLHMKITYDDVQEFFLRIVRETVAYREQNGIRRNDFMDLLIGLKNNATDDKSSNLSLKEMTAQAFIFFAAGFETSSTTMAFALYELAQNIAVQEKAREEVLNVLENHNNEYTYESVKEMRYVDQIISETLRLYTVLPVLNRVCLEDYPVLGHPKYVIKKGMTVLIPACGIHRDPAYYPEPDVFNPEHFEPQKVQQRDSVKWLPFGDGPRNCIGMRFGQMQSRIGLAVLLQHFRFSVCDQTEIPIKLNLSTFLIASQNGIYLSVEKV